MGDQSKLIRGVGIPLASNESLEGQSSALTMRTGCTGTSHFEIYRADQVRLTSILFGGGDWHWRLTDRSGMVLADCGGYRNHRDCLAVVKALRIEARDATISSGYEDQP